MITKSDANKFLKKNKEHVDIKVVQKKGEIFVLRGEFEHKGKVYRSEVMTKFSGTGITAEESLLDIIEGFENDYNQKIGLT